MLISLLWENSLGNYSGRWKPGGGPRWYGTHPPQGPLALMGSQEPKYSSPMGPIRVPRSGDAGGKARVLSLARPTRLILGGSLGDTHPCSTFATTSSFSFLKHLPDKLNIPRLSMKLDIHLTNSLEALLFPFPYWWVLVKYTVCSSSSTLSGCS